MGIEEKNKVGYGSWHCSQAYREYRDFMSFEDYERHIYKICESRIASLGLQEGDIIRFVYIGGFKPRKVSGELIFVNSMLHIRQKSREVSYNITLIDDIDVIKKSTIQNTSRAKINTHYFKQEGEYLH